MSKRIILAGGCFWGLQAYMSALPGVISTQVGYANGLKSHPTYEQVKTGTTGFAEACNIEYDPAVMPLRTLLRHYLRIIDPTALNRQGPDVGTQYRTAVFYNNDEERRLAEELLAKEQKHWDRPVVTKVEPLVNFYAAEEYHQNYLKKNPCGYCHVNLALLDEPLSPEEED
jgi:methionine-S-sulfoxide reductase